MKYIRNFLTISPYKAQVALAAQKCEIRGRPTNTGIDEEVNDKIPVFYPFDSL